jgi:O-antigen/teichoic acid export membrane protein
LDTTRTVAKNTFLLTLGLMVGRLLAILITKKMTPILGTDGLGIWGWATDVTAIGLVIANFGLGTLITREVARARAMTLPILWAALRVRWLMGAACYLGLLGYVLGTGKEPLAREAMLVTALAVFIESTAMACDSILQAHEKFQYQTVGQLISAVVYFGLAFWALEAGYGLMGVVWSNLVSRVVRLLVMAPLMFLKTGPWRFSTSATVSGPSFGWMLRLGWPLFLSSTFGIIYFKIDIAMLTEMVGKDATGIYFLGHRPLDIMLILPNLFATAFFPAMARLGAGEREDTARMGERAYRYLLLGLLPLAFFCVMVAEPIIRWFDRLGEFPDSIIVLRVVIWGLPFQAASVVFNRLLLAAGRERDFITIALVAMLTNVLLNLLLIPRFSYFGAAAASVASLVVNSVLHVYFVRRTRLRIPLLRGSAGCALAVVLAWVATAAVSKVLFPAWGSGWLALPLKAGWGPFLAAALLCSLFYGLAVVGLRVVKKEDWLLWSRLLKPSS